MIEKLIEELRDLIGKSEIEKCLKLFKKNIKYFNSYESEILGFLARYNNYKTQNINGLISVKDQNLILNKLTHDIITVIQKVDPIEDRVELSGLQNLKNNLNLTLKKREKITIYYRRFKTGENFSLSVSPGMRSGTLRDQLVDFIIPEYRASEYFKRLIYFELINLKTYDILHEAKSLEKNGIGEGDIIFLRRCIDDEEEEERDEE